MKKIIFTVIAGALCASNVFSQPVTTTGGTIGLVPVFTGSTVIGNSVIQQSSSNIGIGLSPGYKLDVNGDINLPNTGAFRLGGSRILWNNNVASNIYIGLGAATSGTGGSDNVMLGYNSGYYNSTGYRNIYLGSLAGENFTAAVDNTFVGAYAGRGYLGGATGIDNTYIGALAGYSTESGSDNTCTGWHAGGGIYTASYNSAYGHGAMSGNQSGEYNSVYGWNAAPGGNYSNNSVFGAEAGIGLTIGGNNNLFGYRAGYNLTTGAYNIFMGSNSGHSNDTGNHNVFIGHYAGNSNTSGAANVAMGTGALQNNTTVNGNTAIGFQALYTNTTGNGNTGTGIYALFNNSTGTYNSGYGQEVLKNNGTGAYNVGLGYIAGYTNTAGSNNTFIGKGADANANNYGNATALGAGAIVTTNNMVRIGNTTVATVQGQVAYSTSDGRFKENIQENVKGLEFINKLRPVTYTMNTEAADDFIIQNFPDSIKAIHKQGLDYAGSSAIVHAGLIAQEVEQVSQQVGFNSSIVHHPANATDPYAVAYAELVVPLVKAVQELSKQNESLDSANTAKDAKLQAIEDLLNNLTNQISSCCQQSKSIGNNTTEETQSLVRSQNVELSNKNIVVLNQNVPNPFAEQTTIAYNLPENTDRAQIIFLEQNGKLIKTVELTEKGGGKLNVFANDLSNGTYTYSLIVDGQTIETKKMVKQ